jgi:hypothetical protein
MMKRSLGWVTLWAALAIQGACRADDGYFGGTGVERSDGNRFGDGSGGQNAGAGGDSSVGAGDADAAADAAAANGVTAEGSGPSGGGPDGNDAVPEVCHPKGHDDDCEKCVKESCCPELVACAVTASCSCWHECMSKEDPEACADKCGGWDAEWTVVVSCAELHCGGDC